MKVYAIIVAGGTGSRMGNAVPKQFLPINGKPMLYYSLKTFVDAFPEINIIIVLHPDYISYAHEAIQLLGYTVQIVSGGSTRFHSVQNGINAITNANPHDIIMVHDAARPCINIQLLHNLYNSVQNAAATIPVWPIAESVRKKLDQSTSVAVDRNSLVSVQTPQVAPFRIINEAFKQDYLDAFTDEATVMEHAGYSIQLIDGIGQNIKVTTPEQIQMAEYYLTKH